MASKEILITLGKIQRELVAPKGRHNKFGNYSYRSCEDILEALKPILEPLSGSILLSDELCAIGVRYYVKATATLYIDGQSVSATALARETEVKKGMDTAQITGATSSYARKYALNGLLAIDDTKDADTPEQKREADTRPDYISQQIKKCGDMEALKTFWLTLTEEQQKAYKQEKDIQKATLQGQA